MRQSLAGVLRQSLLFLSLCALGACQQQPQIVKRQHTFDTSELDAIVGPPSPPGRVVGQAFAQTVGGGVIYAAGKEVLLFPVLSCFSEWVEVEWIRGGKLDPPLDRRAAFLIVKTIADGGGNFAFEDVKPGLYYVTSFLWWESSSGWRPGWGAAPNRNAAALVRRVSVESGKTSTVIVTQ